MASSDMGPAGWASRKNSEIKGGQPFFQSTFWKSLRIRRKAAIIIIGLMLCGVIAARGIIFTSNPRFCGSCHEMQELWATWNFSKHGPYNPNNPDIHNCLKCHAKPGVIGSLSAKINRLFSIAYHFSGNYLIEATHKVACIQGGCHQMEDMDRAFRPDRTVRLNHANHLKVMKEIGTRYQCMPCHRNIAHGEEKYRPNMKADCITLCHTDRDISSINCVLCHATHPSIALKGKESALLELHKDAEITCIGCHREKDKAMKAGCGDCHEDKNYRDLVVYNDA